MKIEDVMTRRVVAARADTDLAHVARLMWDNDCGSVPVVDAEDKVIGILTDRDLCMGAHFSGRTLRELRAAGSMASEVLTCRAGDSPASVAKRMGEKRVRRVPVVDDGGRLIGLLSVGDLLCAASRAPAKDKKAIQGALVEALTAICARPSREEVAPVPPAKKRAEAAARVARSSAIGKKRVRV
jgi:CBS domain-containing protein